MFGNFGMTEILMLLVICLVLFGAKRIPEIGTSLGKGIREFKRGVSEIGNATSEPESIEPPRGASSAPAAPREVAHDDDAPPPRRLM